MDPLLHALGAVPGMLGRSAFVDDWSLFCRDLQTLLALRPLFQRFECATGQRINIPKSGILPTRPMTRAEQCCVRIFWGTIQILDKARILGLWIGFAATIDDQYAAALDKFSRALQDFSAMRPRWSLAMRIAIANSFMLSLFSKSPGILLNLFSRHCMGQLLPLRNHAIDGKRQINF